MAKNVGERREYMNSAQRAAWNAKGYVGSGDKQRALPRTHQNCTEITGVARPGKTAHDRAKREGKH